jgi:hypothetical protein
MAIVNRRVDLVEAPRSKDTGIPVSSPQQSESAAYSRPLPICISAQPEAEGEPKSWGSSKAPSCNLGQGIDSLKVF